MKRLLGILMMILTINVISFAKDNIEETDREIIPRHIHKMQKMGHHRSDPETVEARTIIETKKLEIRKELLNENPDWEKIEKLNIEMATEEAKLRTKRMKLNFKKECKH